MKLVVGLGNPGEKYKDTRHNVGFWVVDKLRETFNFQFSMKKSFNAEICEFDNLVLAKLQTFMNKSGVAVKLLTRSYKLKAENLYVVHDDLDIELGQYKISFGKGPKDHRGLRSIYEQIGTKDFWHVRIGIDNRMKQAFKGTGEEYVLSKWRGDEKKLVERVIEKVVEELENVLT
jgi:PTH1 family peptidyl-tRNA hydrolase